MCISSLGFIYYFFQVCSLIVALIPASLTVQWIRIRLPVQGTQVQSLIQEESTCCRATKSTGHSY